ncbi:MAG: flavin reductase family protein [Planctomycetota bacterium]
MSLKIVRGPAAMKYLSTRPTMIITTLHESGVVNAGVFGSWTNLSSSLVGAAISTGSDTYANIVRSGEFTVSIPGADIVSTIAVLASNVPSDVSELDEAGLTAADTIEISAPGVAECAAAVEFRFQKEVEIGSHSFLIGEAVAGWAKEDLLDEAGRLDLWKAQVIRSFRYPEPVYHLAGEVVKG